MNNNTMNSSARVFKTSPAEHEVFQIVDGVSDLTTTARRLKAVTTAFAEAFTENASGADIDEIRNRPEHFCYLFDTLRDLVIDVEEQAAALDDLGDEYLTMKRQQAAQQAAGSPTAPATAQEGEQAPGDLEAPTDPAQAV